MNFTHHLTNLSATKEANHSVEIIRACVIIPRIDSGIALQSKVTVGIIIIQREMVFTFPDSCTLYKLP